MKKLILPLVLFMQMTAVQAWTYKCDKVILNSMDARIQVKTANILAEVSLDGVMLEGTYTANGDDYELIFNRFYDLDVEKDFFGNYSVEKNHRGNVFACGEPGNPCVETEEVTFSEKSLVLKYSETFRMRYLTSNELTQFNFHLACKLAN